MGAIEHPPLFAIPGVQHYLVYTWVVMVLLCVVSYLATRRLELVPHGVQNVMEMVLEQFLAMLDDVIGHDGRRYLPLIATLGLYILVSNLLGLIPGLMAPTGNLNTTAACALIVFVTAVHAPVSGHPRYHLPLIPLFAAYAAQAWAIRRELWTARRTWPLRVASVCAALLAVAWLREVLFVELERYLKALGWA